LAAVPTSSTEPINATFLTVTGSGAKFSDQPIPVDDSMVALSCATVEECTVIGQTNATLNTYFSAGVAAVTSDAGATWTAGSVPAGFGMNGFSQLVCSDSAHCIVTGQIPINNAEHCSSTQPGTPSSSGRTFLGAVAMAPSVRAISQAESAIAATWAHKTQGLGGAQSCSSQLVTEVSAVATSDDGGRTWTPEALPNDVPNALLNGLACGSHTVCWVSGSESIPQKVGNSVNGGSSVLLGTTDGGATWSKVTFSVTATAPNPTGQSYLAIFAISCPSPSVCLAKGGGAQGADVSPIYSLVIPAH
jgi:hypothetical protein